MVTAKEKAVDYLSRREHSRLELEKKLRTKKFSETEIDSALSDSIAPKKQNHFLNLVDCYY